MMKHIVTNIFALIAIVASFAMVSCSDYTSLDYTEIEQEIFDDWMAKYHPDLLVNYQEDGGYYVDLISQGDTSGIPLRDSICWVEYDLTGYDLYGNVSVTRNDVVAWQQGAYSDYTHYVPYYRMSDPDYDEEEDDVILECTQLAFMNELTIGDRSDVLLYNGAEFLLYSPSSISSSTGTNGTGGYNGQFTLSTLPFICKIKIVNVVYQPTTYENNLVDAFALTNGGLTINPESFNNTEIEDEDDDDEDEDSSDEDEVLDPNAWTNATSYISHVYLNKYYALNLSGASFNYVDPYTTTVPSSPYVDGIAALDSEINLILDELFEDEYDSEGEVVGTEEDATVWYICRLLDGFIVDTNIAEIKDLIYNTTGSTGSAISYCAEDDEESYIAAWYYSIPQMRYGNWAAIVTTSTYAYGSTGVNGDTTTTSSSTYSDYYNYYNSYYSGYSSYYSGYYDSSYYYDYSSSSTDTTTISTEILPFAPLIFQIFIEAYDD